MNTRRPAPWYRHGYVWLLILFPALSVAAGFATVWLAVATEDGLVVDDYYRQGLQINEVKERDRRAQELGLDAQLHLDGELRVSLSGNERFALPEAIQISFLHRTRAGMDQTVILSRLPGTNSYAGPRPALPPGNWFVLVEADGWRLLKEEKDTASHALGVAAGT